MNKALKLSSVAAALIVSGMLVGCGSSSSGGKNNSTTGVTTKDINVVVVNGYVMGAKVAETSHANAAIFSNNSAGKYTVSVPKTVDEMKAQFGSIKGCVDANADGKCGDGDIVAPGLYSLVGGKVLNPFTTFIAKGDVSEQDIKNAFKLGSSVDLGADYLANKPYNASVIKTAVLLGRTLASNATISPRAVTLPTKDSGGKGETVELPNIAPADYQAIFNKFKSATSGLDSNATTDDALQAIADSNGTSAETKAIAKAIKDIANASVEANGSKAIETNAGFISALPANQKIGNPPATNVDIKPVGSVELPVKPKF